MSYFDINKVNYEGPKSNNAFSFKYYNPEEKLVITPCQNF